MELQPNASRFPLLSLELDIAAYFRISLFLTINHFCVGAGFWPTYSGEPSLSFPFLLPPLFTSFPILLSFHQSIPGLSKACVRKQRGISLLLVIFLVQVSSPKCRLSRYSIGLMHSELVFRVHTELILHLLM